MNDQKKLTFQNDINGLRGISVLLVVLYHFNIGVFGGGFIGVDIFFVISGYLMTKIIFSAMLRDDFNYLSFISKRAFRIIPALFFLIFFLLLVGYFFLPPSDLNGLAKQSLQSLVFNSNNYFASLQGYFNAGADDTWLLHTWSLSVEWKFYMLYPAVLWLCFSINKLICRPGDQRASYALLVAFFVFSLAYCISQDSQNAFFSTLTRAWEMIAGGLVYLLVSRNVNATWYRATLSYSGLVVILISTLLVRRFGLEALWPSYFALLPVLGACMILLASYENNVILNNRFIQGVGSWSYSIYLWHWPLFIFLSITGLLSSHPKEYKVGGVLFSILLGYASYRFIESSPMFKKTLNSFGLLKIAAAGALLSVVSYAAVQSEGFIFRVKDQTLFRNIETAESSSTFDSKCENTETSRDKFCVINPDVKGRKILIIGDSHAGHLYPWFLKNSKINTTFYVKSGCPIIPGFERMGADKECRKFTEQAFALAASGTYQSVLISQNWSWFSKRSDSICSFYGNKCVALSASNDPLLSVERTRQAIEGVLAKNVDVAILDSTPWFGSNAPKSIARDLFWFGKISKDFDAKKSLASDNREYDVLFDRLKSHPNFKLLSLRSKLCSDDDCYIYDAVTNAPIYKDQSHFNPAWIIGNGGVFSPLVN